MNRSRSCRSDGVPSRLLTPPTSTVLDSTINRFVKLLASAIGAIGNVEQTIIDGVFSLGSAYRAERVHALQWCVSQTW